jgi:hypothetical protein
VVLPHLGKGASIINTSSVTAYKGSGSLLDYSATKAAQVRGTSGDGLLRAGGKMQAHNCKQGNEGCRALRIGFGSTRQVHEMLNGWFGR